MSCVKRDLPELSEMFEFGCINLLAYSGTSEDLQHLWPLMTSLASGQRHRYLAAASDPCCSNMLVSWVGPDVASLEHSDASEMF